MPDGRLPVIMCNCSDWLTCEHPWPTLFHLPPFPNIHQAYRDYRSLDAQQPSVREWPGFDFIVGRDLGDESDG